MTCSSKTARGAASAGAGSPRASKASPGSTSWSPTHVDDPAEVVVATETDRGLFVGALVAAGYTVLAVNPLSVARYRERHSTSGAKSDPGDAQVLADLARTDGHNHRPVAGDSDLGRGGQGPGPGPPEPDLDPAAPGQPAALDAARVLPGRAGRVRRARPRRRPRGAGRRTDPGAGPALSRSTIAAALRRGGRQRRIDRTRRRDPGRAAHRPARSTRRSSATRWGRPSPALVAVIAELTPRSPGSRPTWPTVLTSTRTPRSSAPCQD